MSRINFLPPSYRQRRQARQMRRACAGIADQRRNSLPDSSRRIGHASDDGRFGAKYRLEIADGPTGGDRNE